MFELRVDKKSSLSRVELGDAESLFALIDASRSYLREWMPWVDATVSADDVRKFVQSALEQHARNDGFHGSSS
jgi:ribosomal-protein-serine acetyltransferase